MNEKMSSKENSKAIDNISIPNDWELINIGDLFDLKNGINAPKESYGKGVKFINVMEVIYRNYITSEIITGNITLSDKQISDYTVKRGDVLFNRTSETKEEIGLAAVYLDDPIVVFGGFVIKASPKNKRIIDDYKKYIFHSNFVREQIIKGGQGAIRSNIGQCDLEKVKLPIPPLFEQKTIARILGLMDSLIISNNKIVTQYELRKKWLMQQLLNGSKRLKGFSEEWKENKLSDLFDRVLRKNTAGNTTVVTISAQRGFVRQTDFFNKNIASEITDDYFLVEKGEFCYNKSYSNGYPWGATKRLNDFDKAVVTTLYICFGVKDENATNPEFFEQYFGANLLDKGLTKIAHEGGRAHGLLNVTPSDFFSLKVSVPLYKEQTAIAQVLQAADKEIKLLKVKSEKLREQKKWIMQQLLTGKKRLSV
ncbi:MAG: restriction endonuclease subunit S [Chitinophagaceae bacterium BSSC1]|nr:MAG: restriction endonuclease subunit S [Chitinophagaceae bacterium BSSC1]